MQTLDDILEGKQPEVEPQEPEPEEAVEAPEEESPKEETTEAQPEEEPEKGAKEEDKSEPPSDLADDVKGMLAALKAERERRQKAESERDELKEKKETPSVFEDEAKFVESLRGEMTQAVLNERLNVSEAYARDKFGSEKVDEAFETFQQLRTESPELANRIMQSPMPWVEMVSAVEKHREFEAMKDVDSYKAKLRAEVEAELRKELETKSKDKENLRKAVPTSLVDEPSKGSLKGSDWEGPPPLESILGS